MSDKEMNLAILNKLYEIAFAVWDKMEQVAYIKPSEYGLSNGRFIKGTAIHFTNIINGNGSRIMIVDETYDEVKQLIKV